MEPRALEGHPAADRRPTAEKSLPPDLRAIITRALTHDAARTLAATSSASLHVVSGPCVCSRCIARSRTASRSYT